MTASGLQTQNATRKTVSLEPSQSAGMAGCNLQMRKTQNAGTHSSLIVALYGVEYRVQHVNAAAEAKRERDCVARARVNLDLLSGRAKIEFCVIRRIPKIVYDDAVERGAEALDADFHQVVAHRAVQNRAFHHELNRHCLEGAD